MVNNRLKVYGGEGTYMTSVGDELIKQGHEVQYFGLPDDDNLHGNVFNIYAKRSRSPFSIFKSKFNRKQFAKVLDAFHPDIIHLNLIYYTLTPFILLEAKKRSIPVVQTIHDSKMVCPSYQLYSLKNKTPCAKCIDKKYKRCFSDACVKNSKILSYLAYKEQNYNSKNDYYGLIDKFIFPSNFMRDLHVRSGISENKCIVLRNFSRLSKRSGVLEKKNYYIYFGRITNLKGMKNLYDAANAFPNIEFYIVGNGEDKTLFKTLHNCKLFNFKNGEELSRLIAEAKVSIYPSILMENSPMSVAESVFLGTPVIGSRIGGVPEMLKDGVTGLLFAPGDSKDLVNKIHLMEQPQNYDVFLNNCLKNSDHIMNLREYVLNIVEIYESLIE